MKIRNQNGLTLMGFLIVLVIGLFFSYAVMRVLPMYLEYHALVNAMNGFRSVTLSRRNFHQTKIKTRISDQPLGQLRKQQHQTGSYADLKKDQWHQRQGQVRNPGAFFGKYRYRGSFENTVVLR